MQKPVEYTYKNYAGDVATKTVEMPTATLADIISSTGTSFDFDDWVEEFEDHLPSLKLTKRQDGSYTTAGVALAKCLLGPDGAQWRKKKDVGLKVVLPGAGEEFRIPAPNSHSSYSSDPTAPTYPKLMSWSIRKLNEACDLAEITDQIITSPLSQSLINAPTVREWHDARALEGNTLTESSLILVNNCLQRPQDNRDLYDADLAAAIKIVTTDNLKDTEKLSFVKQASKMVKDEDNFKYWLRLLGTKSNMEAIQMAIEEVRETRTARAIRLRGSMGSAVAYEQQHVSSTMPSSIKSRPAYSGQYDSQGLFVSDTSRSEDYGRLKDQEDALQAFGTIARHKRQGHTNVIEEDNYLRRVLARAIRLKKYWSKAENVDSKLTEDEGVIIWEGKIEKPDSDDVAYGALPKKEKKIRKKIRQVISETHAASKVYKYLIDLGLDNSDGVIDLIHDYFCEMAVDSPIYLSKEDVESLCSVIRSSGDTMSDINMIAAKIKYAFHDELKRKQDSSRDYGRVGGATSTYGSDTTTQPTPLPSISMLQGAHKGKGRVQFVEETETDLNTGTGEAEPSDEGVMNLNKGEGETINSDNDKTDPENEDGRFFLAARG